MKRCGYGGFADTTCMCKRVITRCAVSSVRRMDGVRFVGRWIVACASVRGFIVWGCTTADITTTAAGYICISYARSASITLSLGGWCFGG